MSMEHFNGLIGESPLDRGIQEEVARQARDYALAHGLVMTPKTADEQCRASHVSAAPLTLLPSPFPHSEWLKIEKLQPLVNKIRFRASNDLDFLKGALARAAKHDTFLQQLLRIADGARHRPASPQCMILRCDYMLDKTGDDVVAKQVEVNMISAAFAVHAGIMTKLHRYLVARWIKTDAQMPDNAPAPALVEAMAHAHSLYLKHHLRTSASEPNAVRIMFVVQPNERNSFDQRGLEHLLWEKHGVQVIRRSMAEIAERGAVNGQTGELTVDSDVISVAYFRAGYTPNDYSESGVEWRARELIEQSGCVAVPTIGQQLCGLKKVQQVLAEPGQTERFLDEGDDVDGVRSTYAGLYSLDATDAGDAAAARALAHPDDYVLKPQREGGGNNLYGEEIVDALKKMSREEREAFILMDRLHPPSAPSLLGRNGGVSACRVVSELGVFGTAVVSADHDSAPQFTCAGVLLRSKPHDIDDGGVAANVAVLDSPLLV